MLLDGWWGTRKTPKKRSSEKRLQRGVHRWPKQEPQDFLRSNRHGDQTALDTLLSAAPRKQRAPARRTADTDEERGSKLYGHSTYDLASVNPGNTQLKLRLLYGDWLRAQLSLERGEFCGHFQAQASLFNLGRARE
jgi:hypothetical protein